jgi:hypothetical protein
MRYLTWILVGGLVAVTPLAAQDHSPHVWSVVPSTEYPFLGFPT